MDPTPPFETRDTDALAPSWLTATLVAIPTILILFVMLGVLGSGEGASAIRFPSLLLDNTPTGGDIGAHVLLPQILRDNLLPSWWIAGWSDAWFAGFPALYFYFPIPMLAAVLLDVIMPSGVALKIVISAGLVALPGVTYLSLRWMGFGRLVAAVAASGGAVFVLMESYDVFGGNIKSTLAGEFAFSWSITLAVLYLGLVARDMKAAGRMSPWPGIVLALVALSHVVSTIIVVAITLPWLFRRRSARTVAGSWLLGFGLSAFWSIPFAVRALQGMTSDMRWASVKNLVGPESPFPLEIVPALLLAVVGLGWCVARQERFGLLLGLVLVGLGGYLVLPWLGVGVLNNGRLLPYWYLGVFIFAGIGFGLAVGEVVRSTSRDRNRGPGYAVVAVVLVALVSLAFMRDVPHWVAWDFSGYEGKEEYGEYEALMQTIASLPPGRVAWEESEEMYQYGTQLALMLFPYWSPEHPSMTGVYLESSLTTPFNILNATEIGADVPERIEGLTYHPMDFDRGIAHLAVYGVAYYVSFTDEAREAALEAGLEPVAVARPWVVFALPSSNLVDAGVNVPSVWAGEPDFTVASLEWYDDVTRLDEWLVADGPPGWPRVDAVGARRAMPVADASDTTRAVRDVVVDNGRISFETAAIGVPHLVKVSYFPNWSASGADGPFRAAPSLMVVVPTSETVVLEFSRTWVEYLGLIVTFVSTVGVVVWLWVMVRDHWKRGRTT